MLQLTSEGVILRSVQMCHSCRAAHCELFTGTLRGLLTRSASSLTVFICCNLMTGSGCIWMWHCCDVLLMSVLL